KSNWVVGVQALHDNPYDGHTLKDAINQMEKIVKKFMCSTILETKASRFYWRSTGYKGKDHHPEDVQVHLSNKSRKKMTRWG
ncbi:hypothetical protein, partial [Leptospira noguchii]